MAYVAGNPKTKKELRHRVEHAKLHGGPGPEVYQPGPFGPGVKDGEVTVEGPHYPEPHKWYARVEVKSGHIVRLIS